MHVFRWIAISLLILAILAFYSPQSRREAGEGWRELRPGVLEFMDDIYATIRGFVAGDNARNGVQDNFPDVDFDRIITMDPEIFSAAI